MRAARAALAIGMLAACSQKAGSFPAAFDAGWQNDGGRSIADVERRLRAAKAPSATNVVVGVTDQGLVGAPLDGGRTWTHTARPDTLPVAAGDLVVFSSRGKLVALDATTGDSRWSVDVDDYVLDGAGDDGKTTVATLSGGGHSLLVTVARDGSVPVRRETKTPLGRPAARGGVAFVPWAGQYVSALDMETGSEIGRLLTRELTSHALDVNGELFFGEKSLLHFDERIRHASSNQANVVALPAYELPGRPIWLGPGAEPEPVSAGARARIRVYASPSFVDGKPGLASQSFVATYFRAVMAFDASSGPPKAAAAIGASAKLRWARALPEAVIGGGAAASGFVLCTTAGKVVRLGANGGDSGALDLGVPLGACSVQAGSFIVPEGKPLGTVAAQLDEAIGALEPDMAAAQRFLLGELGRLEEPQVTQTLIELSTDSRVPPDVRNEARKLLAARRSGAEYMLKALERHYDFLSRELLPPPVGPLADALAALGETRAAPSLAHHLNDPATGSDDVAHAAKALAQVATPNEQPGLRTFLALYRATADEPALVNAVVDVARALLKVGGEEGRVVVGEAARDPLTQPDVARALLELGV